MTPADYLYQYRNLKVQLVNATILLGIDVHRYRNAQDVFDPRNTDKDPTNDVDNMPAELDAGPGWFTAWSALSGKIAQHGTLVGTNKYRLLLPVPTKEDPTPAVTADEIINTTLLARVFDGKGTPELCTRALRLAEAFGLVRPTLGAMQSYCDKYIGLDCNGFVGNYLRVKGCTLVDHETPAYPDSFIPPHHRLSKLDDIRVDSVLCWNGAGHVAIVDTVLGQYYSAPNWKTPYLRCLVCEATAARGRADEVGTNGLNYTTYDIHPPRQGQVFQVKRGLGGSNLNEVYIGNLL